MEINRFIEPHSKNLKKEGNQMKSLSRKLGVILIGLTIFGYGEVWGADWKLYDLDGQILRYYDTESITRPSKNIARVWVRLEYTDKGVIELVKKFGKHYENFKVIIALNEMNCSDKKIRNLSITHYSNEGKVILKASRKSEWEYIVPQSVAENLYKFVCK
jgi:hypothetical protein